MQRAEAYPQRRSIRLRDYDYSSAGAYFVTICVAHRACLLGEIAGGEMQLSTLGRIVADSWLALPTRFPTVELDAFVVMPNHVHAIVALNEPIRAAHHGRVGAELAPPAAIEPETQTTGDASIAPTNVSTAITAPTLGRVVQAFKSRSAIACNRVSGQAGMAFWQRSYYDHIIRDAHDLERIRAYVANNPARWIEDPEYPFFTR